VVQRVHLFLSCRSAMCKNKRFKLRKTTMNFSGLITNYVVCISHNVSCFPASCGVVTGSQQTSALSPAINIFL